MTQLEDTERRGLRRFLQILASTWAVVAFGTIGYTVIEGWSLNESFYMTVITLTTVGFGEVHPLGPIGQVFTSILIMLGVGLLAYSASVLGAFFLDGTFTGYVRRRRLHKAIEGLKDHCIVCGFGRTGSRVIDNLKAREIPFVVIENNEQVAEELLETGVAVIHGSAHHNDVLQEAGIAHARALISCASDDAEKTTSLSPLVLSGRTYSSLRAPKGRMRKRNCPAPVRTLPSIPTPLRESASLPPSIVLTSSSFWMITFEAWVTTTSTSSGFQRIRRSRTRSWVSPACVHSTESTS